MNSTAVILASLGLQKKSASMVKVEKQMLSICACTGLSLDEVAAKTRGQHRDLDEILKAAAITGKCMSYDDAWDVNMAQRVNSWRLTGRKLSEIKAL